MAIALPGLRLLRLVRVVCLVTVELDNVVVDLRQELSSLAKKLV